MLTMFGSIYKCECAFSRMNVVKSSYFSLINEHLDQFLHLAITPFVQATDCRQTLPFQCLQCVDVRQRLEGPKDKHTNVQNCLLLCLSAVSTGSVCESVLKYIGKLFTNECTGCSLVLYSCVQTNLVFTADNFNYTLPQRVYTYCNN